MTQPWALIILSGDVIVPVFTEPWGWPEREVKKYLPALFDHKHTLIILGCVDLPILGCQQSSVLLGSRDQTSPYPLDVCDPALYLQLQVGTK